jgi:formylglycine-generating enzyme required for sulfatase activity
LDDIAWYGGNSSVGLSDQERGTTWQWDTGKWPEKQYPGGLAATRLVKGKAPNNWGLYDMIGNVYEWCEDERAGYPVWAVTDYCKSNSSTALGVHRVVRGGSAGRDWYPAGYRGSNVGFRPVCSAGTVQ